MKKPLLFLLMLSSRVLWAQLPTNSFAVTTPCPASQPQQSSLQKINTDGTMTVVNVITDAGTGTPIILNALGYDNANQGVLYGARVVTPTVASILANTPPDLYRVNLATAQATNVGPLTPPATPPASELTQPNSGESSFDIQQTLNFVGDSGPNSVHYIGGATFRIIYQTFLGLPIFSTARVTDARLHVGTIQLSDGAIGAPNWNRLNTSDPATAAIVEDFRVKTQTYIRNSFSGPVPDGGIQDWVYDKSNGNLVSYMGQTDQYLTISNPGGSPVGVTTSPSTVLPALTNGSADKNIGSMFSDSYNNVYAVRASSGEIFRIDNLTGNYSGRSYGAVLGCNRGDAVSFANALPLPVTLTRFTAEASGATVRVNWATSSEQAVAYFEVERSATGTNWQPATRVKATNRRDGHTYSAVDTAPLAGLSYYRLAIHDADGKVAYSQVQAVNRLNQEMVVYPNPARELVQVQLPASSSPSSLELLNAQGKVVRRQQFSTNFTQLPTADLPGGFYLLRARQAGTTYTTRVVLQGQ